MALTKVTYSMIDGAIANVLDYGADPTGTADSLAAIQSAINAVAASGGGQVFLPTGNYKVTNQITITTNGVSLIGEGALATCITSNSATANIIKIGDGTTQVNSVFVEKLRIERSIQYSGSATGIYIDYAAHVKIIDVDSHESVYGYRFTHTNNLKIQRCKYVTQTFNGGISDSAYGWYFDSVTTKPNASAEIRDCEAIFLNYAGTSYGAYIYGDDIKDAFLDAFESANATYGLWIESTNMSGTANFDIHVHRNIHDSFKLEGIVIKNLFNSGSVSIVGGWTGPLNTSAIQNIRIEDSRGVTINGATIFGGANFADNIGVYLKSSSTCAISGCTFTGNRTSIKIEDEGLHAITGNTFANFFGQTADKHISCINTYRNAITGNTIDGPMNWGIYLDATSDSNSIYGNSVNPASVVNAEIDNFGGVTNSISSADNDRGLSKIWGAITAGSSPSIISSYYVASVTRASDGKYTVNFAAPLPNANYVVLVDAITASAAVDVYIKAVNYTVNSFEVESYVANVATDVAQFNFVLFAPNT